jgi:hypothetical protein
MKPIREFRISEQRVHVHVLISDSEREEDITVAKEKYHSVFESHNSILCNINNSSQ